VPLLVLAGLPADVANGTNRVGVLLQSLGAWSTFRRSSVTAGALAPIEVGPAVLGGVLGALVSTRLDADAFTVVIGWAMLALLPTLFVSPARWAEGRPHPAPAWVRAAGFFAIGAYGGFLQAGVGIFLLLGSVVLSGRGIVAANAAKVVLVALFTAPAVVVFAVSGLIDWVPALAVAVGSIVGGRLGARWSLAWGADAIRAIVCVVVVATSGSLLGWW
jgi:uncharacterized membrane protein YfcA